MVMKDWRVNKYTGDIPAWSTRDFSNNIWIIKDYDGWHLVGDEGTIKICKSKSNAIRYAREYMKNN